MKQNGINLRDSICDCSPVVCASTFTLLNRLQSPINAI